MGGAGSPGQGITEFQAGDKRVFSQGSPILVNLNSLWSHTSITLKKVAHTFRVLHTLRARIGLTPGRFK